MRSSLGLRTVYLVENGGFVATKAMPPKPVPVWKLLDDCVTVIEKGGRILQPDRHAISTVPGVIWYSDGYVLLDTRQFSVNSVGKLGDGHAIGSHNDTQSTSNAVGDIILIV